MLSGLFMIAGQSQAIAHTIQGQTVKSGKLNVTDETRGKHTVFCLTKAESCITKKRNF